MAYHFTKTSSSDYIDFPTVGDLAARLNGAAKVSWAGWVKFYTLTTGNEFDNIVVRVMMKDGAASTGGGIIVNICKPPVATNVVRVSTRSTAADVIQSVNTTATISAGAWIHLGFAADYAADAIAIYIDGVAQSLSGSPTYGASVFTDNNNQTTTDGFSSNGGSSGHHADGDMAEMGLWTSDIGAAGFAELATGVIPSDVSRSTLISYCPLRHHLTDLITGAVLTITGTVPQAAHPPLIKEVLTPRVNPYSSRARRRA